MGLLALPLAGVLAFGALTLASAEDGRGASRPRNIRVLLLIDLLSLAVPVMGRFSENVSYLAICSGSGVFAHPVCRAEYVGGFDDVA